MIFKKVLVPLALAAASTLVLAGCAASAASSGPAETATGSAKETPTAEAAASTFNAGGFLGGNVTPTLPDGDAGKIAIVAQGPLQLDGAGGGSLLFAFRNNTDKAVSHVDFTATATVDGKLVATGQSQGTVPAQVQPGEAGFAYIYFGDVTSVPEAGATYEFNATTSPADTSFYNTAPLTVSQADNNGTSIIGSAVNKTGKPLTGPYSVSIYCFNGNDLADQLTDFAMETGDIEAGASVSFSAALYDTVCDSYVVGVSGYFQ